MVKVKKFVVCMCLGILCAPNSEALGNIWMHHTRIEVQKAYFQYIKVEPNWPLFIQFGLQLEKSK